MSLIESEDPRLISGDPIPKRKRVSISYTRANTSSTNNTSNVNNTNSSYDNDSTNSTIHKSNKSNKSSEDRKLQSSNQSQSISNKDTNSKREQRESINNSLGLSSVEISNQINNRKIIPSYQKKGSQNESYLKDSWSLSMVSTDSDEIHERVQGLKRPITTSYDSSISSEHNLSVEEVISKPTSSINSFEEIIVPKHSLLTDVEEWMLKEAKRISIIAKSKSNLAKHLLEQNPDFSEDLRNRILDPKISPDTLIEEERERIINERKKKEQEQLEEAERLRLEKKREWEILNKKKDSKLDEKEEITPKAPRQIEEPTFKPPKDHWILTENPNRLTTNLITTDHMIRNRGFHSKGYHIQSPIVNTRVNIIGFFAQKKEELLQKAIASNLQKNATEKENKLDSIQEKPHRFKPQKIYSAQVHETNHGVAIHKGNSIKNEPIEIEVPKQNKLPLIIINQELPKLMNPDIKSQTPNIKKEEHFEVEVFDPLPSPKDEIKTNIKVVKHESVVPIHKKILKNQTDQKVKKEKPERITSPNKNNLNSKKTTSPSIKNSNIIEKKEKFVSPPKKMEFQNPSEKKSQNMNRRLIWSRKDTLKTKSSTKDQEPTKSASLSKPLSNISVSIPQASTIRNVRNQNNLSPSDISGEEILSARSESDSKLLETMIDKISNSEKIGYEYVETIPGLEDLMPLYNSIVQEAHQEDFGELEEETGEEFGEDFEKQINIQIEEHTGQNIEENNNITVQNLNNIEEINIQNNISEDEQILPKEKVEFTIIKNEHFDEKVEEPIEKIKEEYKSLLSIRRSTLKESKLHQSKIQETLSPTQESNNKTTKVVTFQENTFPVEAENINKYNAEIENVIQNAKEHFSQAAEQYNMLMHDTSQNVTKQLSSAVGDVSRSMTISITKFKNQFDHLQSLTSKTMDSVRLYNQFDDQVNKVMQTNLIHLEQLSSQIVKMELSAEEKMRQFQQRLDENQRTINIINVFGKSMSQSLQDIENKYKLSPPKWRIDDEFKIESNPLPPEILDIQKISEAAAMLRLDSQKIMDDVQLLNYKPLNFSDIEDEELRISLSLDSIEENDGVSLDKKLEMPKQNFEGIENIQFDPSILVDIPKQINIEQLRGQYPDMIGTVLKHSLLNFQPVKIEIPKSSNSILNTVQSSQSKTQSKTQKSEPPKIIDTEHKKNIKSSDEKLSVSEGVQETKSENKQIAKKTLDERRLERKTKNIEVLQTNEAQLEKVESPKIITKSKKLQVRQSSPAPEMRTSFTQYDLDASPIPQRVSHEVSVASSQTIFPPIESTPQPQRIITHECNVQTEEPHKLPPLPKQETKEVQSPANVDRNVSASWDPQIINEMRDSIVQTLQKPIIQVYSERIQTSPPEQTKNLSPETPVIEKKTKRLLNFVENSLTKSVEFEVQVDFEPKQTKPLTTSQSIEIQAQIKKEKKKITQSIQEIQTSPPSPPLQSSLSSTSIPQVQFESPVAPIEPIQSSIVESNSQLSQFEQSERDIVPLIISDNTQKKNAEIKSKIKKSSPTKLKKEASVPIEKISIKTIEHPDYSEINNLQTKLTDIEKWKREKKLLEEMEAEEEKLKLPKDMHSLKNHNSEKEDIAGVMYTNFDRPKKPPIGESVDNFKNLASNYEKADISLFTDIVEDQIRKRANDAMEDTIHYAVQNILNDYLNERIQVLEEQVKIKQLQEKVSGQENLSCIHGVIYSPELDEYIISQQLSLQEIFPTLPTIVEELILDNLNPIVEDALNLQEIEVVEGITNKEAEEALQAEILSLVLVLTEFNFYTKTEITKAPISSTVTTPKKIESSMEKMPEINHSVEISKESLKDSTKESQKELLVSTKSSPEKEPSIQEIDLSEEIEQIEQSLHTEEEDDENLHTFEYQPAIASVFLYGEVENTKNYDLLSKKDEPETKKIEVQSPRVETPRKEPIIVEKPIMEQAGVQTSRLITLESITTQTKTKKTDTFGMQTKEKKTSTVSITADYEPKTPKAAIPPRPQSPPKIITREAHTSPIKIETPPKVTMTDVNTSPIESFIIQSLPLQDISIDESISKSKELPQYTDIGIQPDLLDIDEEIQPIIRLGKQQPHYTSAQLHMLANLPPSPESSVASSDIFSEISNFEDVLRELPPIDNIWKEYENKNLPESLRNDRRALLSHIIRENNILDDTDSSQNGDSDLIDTMEEDIVDTYFKKAKKSKRSDADSENSMFSQMSQEPKNKKELIDILLKASLYEVKDDESMFSQ